MVRLTVGHESRIDSRHRIAVDLTPMLPGGEGGGVKVLTIDLLRRMRQLAPQQRLLILTTSANHDEIEALFDGGVELELIRDGSAPVLKAFTLAHRILSGPRVAPLGALFNRMAHAAVARSRWLMAQTGRRRHSSPSLRERGVDLLFCPFTAPIYAEPGIRIVSILYDLQHLEYPQFFAPQEVMGRNTHLEWLRRWADVVVCISEHSRRTLLDRVSYPPERTRVVPIAVHDRLRSVSVEEVKAVRTRFGLHREFVLYPANGWPHKNHRLLLAAFGLMRARNPQLDVDLVFTGAPGAVGEELVTAARRMGLQSRTHWVGYCTHHELAALYQGCQMMVFPSLYEGFGIPLLEAMWFGKPVACSRTTSLPEVGGDAVRYFDPRRPEDIAAAMADVLSSPALAAELVARGRRRVELFEGDAMASAYLSIFDELLRERPAPVDSVAGVFADGWTSGVVRLAHAGGAKRMLELELEVPDWLPHQGVAVSSNTLPRRSGRWHVSRGRRDTLQIPLPPNPGYLSFEFSPLFRPSDHGMGDDVRLLGCRCCSAHIIDGDRRGPNLLAAGGGGS